VVASLRKPRDLFTASQIARFCQVDLKTIHNWAERGQIPHFRTPGRHLRFRRPHVLDFLRKYGYPIPEELAVDRPSVALILNGTDDVESLATALRERFEVIRYTSPLTALLHLGERPPDAVVLAAELGPLRGADIIVALKREARTQHVRAVLLAGEERHRTAALAAGASALVKTTDGDGLRDTLEALMGVRH